MSENETKQDKTERDTAEWESMRLTFVGDVGDVIKNSGGQGKSGTAQDSGDVWKPPGQG